MSITIQIEGRRNYLVGNTYPIRARLQGAGCHWDAERRAWWTGDKERAIDLAAAPAPAPTQAAPAAKTVDRDDPCILGRAEYKGKTYYAISGTVACHDGVSRIRLAFRDGSSSFWAASETVTFARHYERPQSIAGLARFAEKARASENGTAPTKQCWECGCAFSEHDARRNDGDWSDSYCGC